VAIQWSKPVPKPQRPQIVGIFVLDNDAVFPWTAYVHVPNPNKPGEKQKFKLPVEFRHITPERRVEILEEWRDTNLAREEIGEQPQGADEVDVIKKAISFERMLLNEAIARFPEVRAPDGGKLPDTDETKQAVLSNNWAVSALLPAYKTFLLGHSSEGN
jgi:hypothetical protein